jgi:hypothetical protein
MHFDEVFRPGNVWGMLNPAAIPQVQEISTIELFGHAVPLMYKEYLSSLQVLWFLPVGLFSDPLTGIRMLYAVYLFAGAGTGFLLFHRLWYWPAFIVTLLALTTPLLYPDVTYGFVPVIHLVPLAGAARCVVAHLRSGSRPALAGAAFLAAFSINVTSYISWTILGLGLAFVMVNPRRAWRVISTGWNPLIILTSAALGLFNYVYFNIAQGFPTARLFLERIFAVEEYNAHPIDGGQAAGAIDEAMGRVGLLTGYMDALGPITAVVAVASALVSIGVAVRAVRRGEWARYRWYYLPGLAIPVTYGAIIFSPNADRAGHFGVLAGVVEAWWVCAYLLTMRCFSKRLLMLRGRALPATLVAILAVGGLAVSRTENTELQRTGGADGFSTAIFGLHDYIKAEHITAGQILQVQWGTYAQLAFLERGEFGSPSVVWQVHAVPEIEEKGAIIANAVNNQGGDVLIPIVLDDPFPWGKDAVEAAAGALGGTLCLVEEFPQGDGTIRIQLYRLLAAQAARAAGAAARLECQSFG